MRDDASTTHGLCCELLERHSRQIIVHVSGATASSAPLSRDLRTLLAERRPGLLRQMSDRLLPFGGFRGPLDVFAGRSLLSCGSHLYPGLLTMSPSLVMRQPVPPGATQRRARRLYRATKPFRRSHTTKHARCIAASANRHRGSASSAMKSGVSRASSSGRIAIPHSAQYACPARIRSMHEHGPTLRPLSTDAESPPPCAGHAAPRGRRTS
jgi:hypothetical protein